MESDEKVLYRKLRQGNRQAFEGFYAQTYSGLLRRIHLKVSVLSDAEEIAHDVYLSFLDSLPIFAGKSSLKTFLYAIARHEIADYFRKKYAKKIIMTVPFIDHVYNEKLYTSTILNEEIERIYTRLSNEYVVILRLRYEEELKIERIAKRLRLTLKAAESRLFRARKAFQKAYQVVYG